MSKLLSENGANLQCGDVGQFACNAVEQNSLNLLKEIMRYGGDITLPNSNTGTTEATIMMQHSTTDRQQNKLIQKNAQLDKPG